MTTRMNKFVLVILGTWYSEWREYWRTGVRGKTKIRFWHCYGNGKKNGFFLITLKSINSFVDSWCGFFQWCGLCSYDKVYVIWLCHIGLWYTPSFRPILAIVWFLLNFLWLWFIWRYICNCFHRQAHSNQAVCVVFIKNKNFIRTTMNQSTVSFQLEITSRYWKY